MMLKSNKFNDNGNLSPCYNIYLNDYNQIKTYLTSCYSKDLFEGYILLYLDKDNKLIRQKRLTAISNFNNFCLELLQLISAYKVTQFIVTRVEPSVSNKNSNFENFKNCQKLVTLSDLLGVHFIDYIVMHGYKFESYRFDHGSIGNCHVV